MVARHRALHNVVSFKYLEAIANCSVNEAGVDRRVGVASAHENASNWERSSVLSWWESGRGLFCDRQVCVSPVRMEGP